ncbi:MAG: AAA family ATPase [Thermoproteota archaeon]|jgi:Cdc6-like AAA superfamily ATPase
MMLEPKAQDYLFPLTRGYLPPRLPFREKELSELESFYLTGIKLGSFPTFLLIGPRSSGKTTLALKLAEGLRVKLGLRSIVIDCSAESSEFKIISKTINILGITSSRLKGSSTEELLSFLLRYFAYDKLKTLMVLDNIECLVVNKNKFLLSALLKLNENFREASRNLALLFTANEKEFENLRQSIKEFQRVPVLRLKRYTKEQVYNIIKYRISLLPLHLKFSKSSIERLAELSTSYEDVSLALSLLSSLILEAKSTRKEEITQSDVDDIYSKTIISRSRESFTLSDEEALIFNVILELKGNESLNPIKSSLLWETYQKVCERKGKKLISYTKFWNILVQLERKGLIKRDVKSFGRFGRSTLIFVHNEPNRA